MTIKSKSINELTLSDRLNTPEEDRLLNRYLRELKLDTIIPECEQYDEDLHTVEDVNTPVHIATKEQELEHLREAISTLRPKWRQVLELHFGLADDNEYSMPQAATVMGFKSVNSGWDALKRALKELEKIMVNRGH